MKRALPLVLAVLLAAACGKKDQAPKTPVEAGRAYFTQLNCRSCHRIGGEGAVGGPDLTMTGFRHSKEWLDLFLKDPQAWKKDTLMPNPRLSEPARAALVEYLAAQKGQAWGQARPWKGPKTSQDRGHLLFARAGCSACHGPAGKGGMPNNNVAGGKIPALAELASTYTKDELTRKIARGVVPVPADPAGSKPLVKMPAWSDVLSPEEISDVADYVLTLKPASGSGGEW